MFVCGLNGRPFGVPILYVLIVAGSDGDICSRAATEARAGRSAAGSEAKAHGQATSLTALDACFSSAAFVNAFGGAGCQS